MWRLYEKIYKINRKNGVDLMILDEYGVANSAIGKTGRKNDAGKLRWDLLPYDAVEKVVEILTYGAKKYSENNWQNVETKRYEAAMMRHFCAYKNGEENDQESGLSHLAHMSCNAIFLLWQNINKIKE